MGTASQWSRRQTTAMPCGARRLRIVGAPAVAGVLAALALAACGGSSSSSSASKSATSSAAASSASSSASVSPAAQIKQDWTRFFDGSTPASSKIALLQNGKQFAAVLEAQAKNPLAQQAKAKVSKVQVVSPTKAKVTYTVLVAGRPALSNRVGEALKSGGTWHVADASFCQLLALEGGAPALCRKG